MIKNGKIDVEDEARCSCGQVAVTVEDGVPVCSECASDYDGKERVAHLEPTE